MAAEIPLYQKTCEPCRGGAPSLTPAQVQALQPGVPAWNLVEVDGILRLRREFLFETVPALVHFQARVMEEADAQAHHPNILASATRQGWKLNLDLWTHKIRGLHANDFIMAAKFDVLAREGGTSDGA